jgi:hypothetical protein
MMSDNNHKALSASNTVVLRAVRVALNSETGELFIADCARNTEGSLSELEIRTKYGLSDEDWMGLAGNAYLLSAIRAERDRRIANGDAVREAAQRHLAKAPDVLGGILTDEQVSPRHRIEAAKALRQVAGNDADTAHVPTEKFTIHIDLGADEKLVYQAEIASRPPLLADDGEQS